ncbi:transposable element Tcb2 transposase [Trichonephila clavipes]|nr:transposable element Tcb2 transposase [Trichonephila clavipes]
MQIWKQWTDELRTTRKTGSERRKETSASDDRYLLRMVVNARTASSRLLAARWSPATDESRFNFWNHNGRIRVRRYAGERCLPDYVIERYSGLTLGIKVWGAISYHGLTNLLRIEAQHVQLLPWSAYSPDMSPIERVGDLVGRRFARDPYPAASKNELLLHIQAIWNSFPQSRHSKSV